MNIFFDCRYVKHERHDGISRYTAQLVAAAAKYENITMLISDIRQLAMLPDVPWVKIGKPTGAFEFFRSLEINKFHPDVVFTPMQTIGRVGRRFPLIVTVHDLIYYAHPAPPRTLAWYVRMIWRVYHMAWWPQRMLLKRCNAVVTVSQTTKQRIEAKRLTKHPVYVVSNAADPIKAETLKQREKSLVYMGSFMPYKNVATLFQAMKYLPEYTLHLVSGISQKEKDALSQGLDTSSVVFHNGLSDEDYYDLLGQCTALVSASRDEGFGIPLIESMSVGTPVIVSDIPIFREIAQESALFFDPENSKAFAERVRELEEPTQWKTYSQMAKQRAQDFSWNASAQALLKVLYLHVKEHISE